MIAAEAAEHSIILNLLNEGTVTSMGLASLRRESELMGLPLVDVLQANDMVSEADLAKIYADLKGVRFLDLSRRTPNRAWVLALPENIARRKQCLLQHLPRDRDVCSRVSWYWLQTLMTSQRSLRVMIFLLVPKAMNGKMLKWLLEWRLTVMRARTPSVY